MATTISVLAFLVSLYGVWEKRRDVHQQQLLRLSTVVDELNKLTYEQDKVRDEITRAGGTVPVGIASVSNSRREVLCNEAMSLIGKLGEEVTSSQMRAVASSWSRASYPNYAESLYRRVIGRGKNDIEEFFGWRGLASILMDTGREEEGRAAYRQSLDMVERVAFYSDWDKGETYIRWAQSEATMGHWDRARSLLAEADKCVSATPQLPRRNELARRISSARIDPIFSPPKEGKASAGELRQEFSNEANLHTDKQ